VEPGGLILEKILKGERAFEDYLYRDAHMKWAEKVQVKVKYNLLWMLKLMYDSIGGLSGLHKRY